MPACIGYPEQGNGAGQLERQVPGRMLKRHNGHEKRQFGRRQTSTNAWIRLRGQAAIPCRLINISEGGALLLPIEACALPSRFALSLGVDGPEIACEMRHRHEGRVGVEFVVAAQAAETVAGPLSADDPRNLESGMDTPRLPSR